jgi:hypothetical protein
VRESLSGLRQSFPGTDYDSDRNNQGCYRHPILKLNPKDAESLDQGVQDRPSIRSLLYIWPERILDHCVFCRVDRRGNIVVGRNYFARQVATLLKFAQSTSDPQVAAALVEKAAELKSKIDESDAPDQSPRAPDIEPGR